MRSTSSGKTTFAFKLKMLGASRATPPCPLAAFRLGREVRPHRQYQYSASTPLCYGFKGGVSPTKAASHTGLGRSTVYRDIKRGRSCLSP